ncbi:PRC-barrel domain-containing protein [Euzebya sp.]|uniref:PRC-barrel domain-containing protein n=1 Tax=Euzebya sp. TaxID=1971409 RepID=UPI0035161034
MTAARDALLIHAMDVTGMPVVTLGGDAVAQVRDVLFDRTGNVRGFTLAGRGLFSGPMAEWLPWAGVHGFGPDAIIVADVEALTREGRDPVDGDVVGDEVLTRSGTVVGTVTDAVLRLEPEVLDVVGYEVEPSDGGEPRFIPLPDTLSVTGGRLVVPDEAMEFLARDLSGFGASVDTFRERLRGA